MIAVTIWLILSACYFSKVITLSGFHYFQNKSFRKTKFYQFHLHFLVTIPTDD